MSEKGVAQVAGNTETKRERRFDDMDLSSHGTPFILLLTESSKSPASIAKSNKQWVGTCLYQEECKLLLINCGAVIRL